MKRRCKRTVKSFARRYTTSTCRKSQFYKNRADSLSLSPNPFPHGKGLCMLGWLCVLQSLAAYTPDIRAGAILLGLPPLVPVGGYAPQPHFNKLKPLHGVSHQLVAVKDDRERTVVQELNLHIRTEPSCLHVGYAFTLPALLNDILVQLICHIG